MWKDLSLKEKSELMRMYIRSGITNRSDMVSSYNSFATGSQMDNQPRLGDNLKVQAKDRTFESRVRAAYKRGDIAELVRLGVASASDILDGRRFDGDYRIRFREPDIMRPYIGGYNVGDNSLEMNVKPSEYGLAPGDIEEYKRQLIGVAAHEGAHHQLNDKGISLSTSEDGEYTGSDTSHPFGAEFVRTVSPDHIYNNAEEFMADIVKAKTQGLLENLQWLADRHKTSIDNARHLVDYSDSLGITKRAYGGNLYGLGSWLKDKFGKRKDTDEGYYGGDIMKLLSGENVGSKNKTLLNEYYENSYAMGGPEEIGQSLVERSPRERKVYNAIMNTHPIFGTIRRLRGSRQAPPEQESSVPGLNLSTVDFAGIQTTNNRPYNQDYIGYEYNKLKGYNRLNDNQVASTVGTWIEESGGDPYAVSPDGQFVGLNQWGPDRYSLTPVSNPTEEQIYAEIDRQIEAYMNSIDNLTDKKSWTHGGSGSGYNSNRDAYNVWIDPDASIDDIFRAHSWGYTRPTGKENSYNNRLKVVKQVLDRMNQSN